MAEGTSVGAIYYEVEADTSKLVNSTTSVDGSLDQLNKTFARTDKAANDTRFQMTKTAAAVKGLGAESAAARANVSSLYGALAGLVSLRAAQGLIEMADAYNEMAERIAMATSSADEYEHVQQRLLATANGTYRSLSEAQELYVLTASTLKSLGYDTDQSMDIVDSLSYAFVKNATAADRASTTIDAVTKALNKGKVEADGWQTILAAVPTIVDDLAASTGRSTAEILALGAQGKITGRELSESLRKSLDDNKAAADGMATTVKDAFTNLKNNLSVFVGEANRASGATQLMSGALVALGNNIDTVVSLLMVAGAGALARYIAQLGASAIASGRAMLAARAQAAEELRLAQAHMAATQAALAQAQATGGLTAAHGRAAAAAAAHAAAVTRMQAAQAAVVTVGSRLLGLLGGPVGIIALLASAAASVVTFGGDSKSASGKVDDLSGSVDGLTASLKQLNNAGLSSAAANIQERIGESARLAVEAQDKLKDLQQQLTKAPPGSDAARQITQQMANWGSVYGEAQKNLDRLRDRAKEIQDMQGRRTEAANGPSSTQADPEVAKRLQAMRDELELAKQTGVARARLQALQKLGANATAEERAEAEALATQIYELESAQKAGTKTTKESVAAHKEDAKVLTELATELLGAGEASREMAQAKAAAQLSKFATPEEIAQVKELAGALFDLKQSQADQKLINEADPIQAEIQGYEKKLAAYQDMLARKAISDEEYYQYAGDLAKQHEETMLALQEERFRQQSEFNDLLMTGVEALGEAATNTLVGLITQTTSAADAAKAFAGVIMKEVIGSVVKMGVEQAKAWIMGRAAAAVAGAAYAAGVAGQVQANTALAAQATFASISAIPIVGPFMAPAMAAQAAVTAGALGAPAIPAAAISAGRQYGGPVAADGMYRINETGRPEILNMTNGQQFLLPNQRGEVVSNRDATAQAAGGAGAGSGGIHIDLGGIHINSVWPLPDSEVRNLVGRINDALRDGMTLRTK